VEIAEAVLLVPFLRALSTEERNRLLPYAEIRPLRRGAHVWTQGEPTGEFAFVVRGRVKLVSASQDGRETILEMGTPGELLCANAVCAFAPYCCGAVAMEDGTEILVVPRRDLLDLLERSTSAARAFLREVTCRGLALCRRIEELSSGQVERRIATLLLRLSERMGVRRQSEGTWIPVPLSRQDLADLCGTTIETAIRVMTRLGREGVVRSAARGFVIADPAALGAIARGERV
jgi:CRP/FNR family transcriptional regulator